MKHICAWCKQTLSSDIPDPKIEGIFVDPKQQPVSHGLCHACVSHLGAQIGMSIREFIETLNAPVLLISNNVLVSATNEPARKLLGKEVAQIEGYRGGDVFECVHAAEPGGCGQTIHCAGCMIRKTVTETFLTGRPQSNVPACLNKQNPAEAKQVRFLITTEKVGETVLLQVDEIKKQV